MPPPLQGGYQEFLKYSLRNPKDYVNLGFQKSKLGLILEVKNLKLALGGHMFDRETLVLNAIFVTSFRYDVSVGYIPF